MNPILRHGANPCVIKLAIKTFEASIAQNMNIIDFDDMIFAPLFHNCRFDKYDWVLVDEAQDTNSTRREMAIRMMKPSSRLVAVGDRRQAIYGFTGADHDALDLIGDSVDATYLPLTITYRCPKSVVKYAQQWVSHIEAAETAPEGIVRSIDIESLASEAKIGDAILCRFNAPLVEHVYKFIAAGTPAKIEGREIGEGLKNLIKRWKVKSISTLLDRLNAYQERETAKLTLKDQQLKITALEDKCTCIKIIIGRVDQKNPTTKTPIDDVAAEIDAIFGDNNSTEVVLLSSIHKSKGREWKKVIWLQSGPNKRARLDWQVIQEQNLNYVAATRAMSELILVNIQRTKKKEETE